MTKLRHCQPMYMSTLGLCEGSLQRFNKRHYNLFIVNNNSNNNGSSCSNIVKRHGINDD